MAPEQSAVNPIAVAQMSDAKRRLLEKLLRGEAARQNREAPLEPRAAGVPIPLAPVQQLFWLSSQMAGSEPAYNEPVTIHYRGALDRDVLERAFNSNTTACRVITARPISARLV